MAEVSDHQLLYQDALLELHENIDSEPRAVFDFLYPVDTLDEYNSGVALNLLGILHDSSDILSEKRGLTKCINLGKTLKSRDLAPEEKARLEYILGNCRASLFRINGNITNWDWESSEREEIIRRFRKALDSKGAEKLSVEELQKSYTNLGNALSNTGRWIEAFDYWRNAIEIDESFLRAKGQIGMSLRSYALHLPEPSEQLVLLQTAHDYLRDTLESGNLHPQMRDTFQKNYHWIHSNVSPYLLDMDIDLNQHSLGSGSEQKYRQWCLKNRLFLNPINDVTTDNKAAKDTLHLPTTNSKNELMKCAGFFNQMKQEYVSARYRFWKGITRRSGHYSDKGVIRMNTDDFPMHSVSVEEIKSGLKTSYSIFDKIASLLDFYFDLGNIPSYQLHFDKVWYKSRSKNNLASEFKNKKNWPLRGLFWLSKDLEFESELTVTESLEPGAEELRKLRNNIEHGHVRVLSNFSKEAEYSNSDCELSHDVFCSELVDSTAKIIHKARAALIYLSLGIYQEEGENVGMASQS
ncbi:LA2681 family HEPN domain-containing protein [Haloarculaceae archaeon H-GB1-1]|nr:LA2681 family HEPN domain-containing protein [Haloarculaceae archaeon H-GB1-1]